MRQLREKNLDKCFSLLREYMEEAPLTGKKRTAVLALDQLQRITAGGGTPKNTSGGSLDDSSVSTENLGCNTQPRANAELNL